MNVAQLEDLVSQLRSGKEAHCELNRTAPKEIFLQVSDDEEDFKKPFPKPLSEEVTWSPGPVVVCEVRYVRADLAIQPAIPEGYKLLKNSTFEERSWPEDSGHENGDYYNECLVCGRQFIGHKRRVACKVCSKPIDAAGEKL